MKLTYLAALTLLFPVASHAFPEGTINCKNAVGTVNTYKFETVRLGSAELPYVEAAISYRKDPEDAKSPVIQTITKGIATVATFPDSELLSLNYLRFEFIQGELSNCRK